MLKRAFLVGFVSAFLLLLTLWAPFLSSVAASPSVIVVPITSAEKLLGDLNHDGKVDEEDLSIFQKSWYMRSGAANYNPEADLDKNGFINVKDFAIFGKNWGKTIPNNSVGGFIAEQSSPETSIWTLSWFICLSIMIMEKVRKLIKRRGGRL